MENSKQQNHTGMHTKFALMLAASFIAMYITMCLNTYELDHVYFSLTRFYIACLGISTMAVIMWACNTENVPKSEKEHHNIAWQSCIIYQRFGIGALTTTYW